MATGSSLTPSLGRRPFQATYIWNTLINHLRENTNVKQRRNVKKCPEDCFTGANAVDVLYSFVRRNPGQFTSSTTITKENIIRLCQSFIDNGVLEEVGSNNLMNKCVKFDDTTSSLYTFTEEHSNSNSNESESEMKSLKGRQVLREIDGEIRNSLDHISISSEQKSGKVECSDNTTKQKEILVPMRNKRGSRSRFPSFSGLTAQSLKDTIFQTLYKIDSDDASDTRGRRQLKRSSSYIGLVGKRSSSTSSLHQNTGSLSLDADSADNKDKKSDNVRGPKLRFSQRLSFRKKSFRRTQQTENDANQIVITNTSAVNELTVPPADEDASKGKQRMMNPQEILHIRRECVRVRLLQILDIPFVDNLITSPIEIKSTDNETSCSSSVQYSEVVAMYNSEDSWIASALSVLHSIPDSYDILCKYSKESDRTKKIKLYFAIAEYFQSLSQPIVGHSYEEIATALMQMLATKSVAQSLEAVQLFLHLFPDTMLCQLRSLSSFLHHVINNDVTTLSRRSTNKELVLQTFSSIIFPTSKKIPVCDLTAGCSGLVLFMTEHCRQVFKLPVSVASAVNRKRMLLESGEVESPSMLSDSTFCNMISSKEFNRQRIETTNKHVTDLTQFVISDQSLSSKRKKDFLKKLQSSHPSVYEKTLGPLKATHKNMGPLKATHKNMAPIQAPATEGVTRRKNKARKQVYV